MVLCSSTAGLALLLLLFALICDVHGSFSRRRRRFSRQEDAEAPASISPIDSSVAPYDMDYATDVPDTVCSCLCCFQGGCVAIPNGTFAVEACDGCSGEVCQARIGELDMLWQTTNAGRFIQRPPCLVLHVSETKTCAKNAHCKHFTTVHGQCVDRGEYFQMYSCIIWLTCVVGLVVRGVVKRFREHFHAAEGRR
jgi:hypothetical protein